MIWINISFFTFTVRKIIRDNHFTAETTSQDKGKDESDTRKYFRIDEFWIFLECSLGWLDLKSTFGIWISRRLRNSWLLSCQTNSCIALSKTLFLQIICREVVSEHKVLWLGLKMQCIILNFRLDSGIQPNFMSTWHAADNSWHSAVSLWSHSCRSCYGACMTVLQHMAEVGS